MRTSVKRNLSSREITIRNLAIVRWLAPSSHDEDDLPDSGRQPTAAPRGDDLPYHVELWDASKTAVEQVLAVTRNGSIGYAAYYEATRQFPDRYIVLRHKGRILSRWNGPTH